MISSSAWKTPSPMKIRSVLGYHYFSLWPSPSNRRTPPIDFPYPPSFKKNRLQRGPIECFGTPFRPPSICLYVRFYCRKNWHPNHSKSRSSIPYQYSVNVIGSAPFIGYSIHNLVNFRNTKKRFWIHLKMMSANTHNWNYSCWCHLRGEKWSPARANFWVGT